jgi:heterodisulfide reductase subunit A
MARLGVFVCHCGENIGRTVRAGEVAEFARRIPGTVFSADYPYFCSAPGQKILEDAVREHDLTGVVVAACSPQLHEPTFRGAACQAGLNPFRCEMANIREQCSWVHPDSDEATAKACRIVASTVERVKQASSLDPVQVPVTKRALVIGGGVAGIRAALDMANSGYPVVLVEREPSLGGNMARLSETFPTLDCSQCILTPLMVEAARHPDIEILTYSELQEVSGYVGNFKVRIRRKPSFVRAEDCTGCGDCAPACPEAVPSEFDMGLAWRKAIYIPFPQAVPSTYTLDADRCLNARLDSDTGFRVLACVRCSEACKPKAIDYDMREEIVERGRVRVRRPPGRRGRPGVRTAAIGFRSHPRRDPAALGRKGPEGRRLHPVRGLEGSRARSALLLTYLLHVHGQARAAAQAQAPRRAGHGLLHGCAGGRQGLRGVRATGGAGRAGALRARSGQPGRAAQR